MDITRFPASVRHRGMVMGDERVDRLLRPTDFYDHPDDVVADEGLTFEEKRAILSSWASHACSEEFRNLAHHTPRSPERVPFDCVLDALLRLDEAADRFVQKKGG